MFLTISLSSWLSMSLSTPLTIALARWLSRGLSPQLARTHPQNPFACVRSFDLFRAYRQNISSFNYQLVWRGPYVDMWTRTRVHIKKHTSLGRGGPNHFKNILLIGGATVNPQRPLKKYYKFSTIYLAVLPALCGA